jgi:peptide/nickel transport system ATP-binding protein
MNPPLGHMKQPSIIQRSADRMQRRYDIRIHAGNHRIVAIDGFMIPDGKITFLFGESGIGKSLIAKAVYGLIEPEELTATMQGEDYREYQQRGDTLSMQKHGFFVFQEPSTHLDPLLRLEEQLRDGSLADAPSETTILSRLWDTATYGTVNDLLRVYPKPDRPSGGEKQRMLLTMAFKKIALLKDIPARTQSALFIFDEPSGNLDNHFRDQFLDLLFEYHRQLHFTCLVITHDYSMISTMLRKHRDMLPEVVLKELCRKKETLALRDFEPSAYTNWIGSLTSMPVPRYQAPLLEFESGAEVYGRKLLFSQYKIQNATCPLQLYPGTLSALKAPSGTGKTTIVKMMMGMLPSAKFHMSFCGTTLTDQTPRAYWKKNLWGKSMTMVFQHADEAMNPNAAVKDVFHRLAVPDIESLLSAWFTDTIDDTFLRKQVRYLSGGEKQRLNLLRSLSLNTDLLILDEPLNGLDFESMTRVLNMLRANQRKSQAVLIISHNDDVFDRLVPAEHTFYLRAEIRK